MTLSSITRQMSSLSGGRPAHHTNRRSLRKRLRPVLSSMEKIIYGSLELASADIRLRLLRRLALLVRRDLALQLAASTDGIIQNGNFKGCYLPTEDLRETEDYFIPKLFGFYEIEIADVISSAARGKYDLIVNVGCGNGFYAIALAKLAAEARIIACDTSALARSMCQRAAAKNQIANHIEIMHELTPERLHGLLCGVTSAFILSDCEGYEKILLDPERVPSLTKADLLVECHDFLDPEITSTLTSRFALTHSLEKIEESGRNPNSATLIRERESLIRWLSVCEFRPTRMSWLHIRRKENSDVVADPT